MAGRRHAQLLAGELLADGHAAVAEEGELLDRVVGALLLRHDDLEIGERGHALAEEILDDGAADLLERLGDDLAVILLEQLGLVALEAGALPRAAAGAHGGEIGAAADGGDGAVHALDQRRERQRARALGLDQVDLRLGVDDGGPVLAKGLDGVDERIPAGGILGGAGLAQETRRAELFRVGDPIAQRELLEHVGDRERLHDAAAHGHDPLVLRHVLTVDRAEGRLDEPELAGDVLKKPKRDVDELGREPGLARVRIGGGLPAQLVHGVAHGHGRHHLPDEELEPAAGVALQGVGDLDVVVEELERGLVLFGLRLVFVAEVLDQEDGGGAAGGRLDALLQRGADHIVAPGDGIGGDGEVAQVTGLEGIEVGGEPLGGEVANRVEPDALRQRYDLGRDPAVLIGRQSLARLGLDQGNRGFHARTSPAGARNERCTPKAEALHTPCTARRARFVGRCGVRYPPKALKRKETRVAAGMVSTRGSGGSRDRGGRRRRA